MHGDVTRTAAHTPAARQTCALDSHRHVKSCVEVEVSLEVRDDFPLSFIFLKELS